MTPFEIIKAAIPDADEDTADHVLFGRTPFPMRRVSAKELFSAARRWDRAGRKGAVLCDFCDNLAESGKHLCPGCAWALGRVAARPMPVSGRI